VACDDQYSRHHTPGDVRLRCHRLAGGAATAFGGQTADALKPGDVIHAVNNQAVAGMEQVRTAMNAIKPGEAVVLQIERDGGFNLVSFRAESF
jgi:PDZ domain-containing secreted protein